MLKRDFLVKQLEEFGKVMAQIMGFKRQGKRQELEELIRTTALKFTGREMDEIEAMEDAGMIDALTNTHRLSDEQLKMTGDLLYERAEIYQAESQEDPAINAFRKAYMIYTFLQDHATMPYSLDMHYKLQLLRKFFETE